MNESGSTLYSNYWLRKGLLKRAPHFENIQWWKSDDFSAIEEVYYKELQSCKSILDVGAGDLTLMKKVLRRGYKGQYHTVDIGHEFSYTYSSLEEVSDLYEAVVCLDVIEHLKLEDGLGLLQRLLGLLTPLGTLIVQTPNGRCVRHPSSWDMTHLHCYSVSDLWAYLTSHGTTAMGYRVTFVDKQASLPKKLQSLLSKIVITQLLGCDYADNIVLIAKRTLGP